MALIARISQSHSIRDFRKAARLRFHEARRAVEAGDLLIGIYLAGYAAEMILKATYFQIAGWKPTDAITLQDLQTAKADAMTLGIAWKGRNLHDVTQWAELLIQKRKVQGTPYSKELASSLVGQVARLYSNWRETLRYHGNRPRVAEVVVTLEAVEWLLINASRLAR